MFHRRSRSFNAKNGERQDSATATTSSSRSGSGGGGVPSPLRLFRRNKHHRRSQSEPDANQKAAVAEAIKKAQQEEEYHDDEGILRLSRSDLQVGKILGEGGFAQVFSVKLKKNKKTRHPEQGDITKMKKLALKQLRPQLLQDKDLFERASDALVREARIMTMLKNHKNILSIRGVSSDGKFDSFLIADALRETMTDRVLKWNDMHVHDQQQGQRWMHQLQYCLQVAQALAYCHQHRIVYRDCKVDNLGFSDEHTVQLFDFGLARELPPALEDGDGDDDDAKTCTSSVDEACSGGEEVFHMTMCGTQRHAAPEIYNHHGWYNCKADVYSWAMMLVELITGKKPYPYMSLPVHKILVIEGGGRPNLDGLGFPMGLQHILTCAWEHKLEDRWTMDQVCAALETYIGSECSQKGVVQQSKEQQTTPQLLQDQACANNHLDMVQQQRQGQESEPVLAGAA